MKQFDTASIKSRLIAALTGKEGWGQILTDSATASLFGALAESESELVRYFEYLLREAKWQYAQNTSSLLTEAAYLGYFPVRKQSAIGEVTISHDALLNTADLSRSALEDFSSYIGPTINIPMGTAILSSNGLFYVTVNGVSYTSGLKYIDVPVIQGIIQSKSITVLGNPFEIVGIPNNVSSGFVEAANNDISNRFFSVTVQVPGSVQSIPVSIKEDIYLAQPNEYACEVVTSKDFSTVSVMFGNGVAGIQIPANSIVTINYIYTLGENGNESNSYVLTRFFNTSEVISSLNMTNFGAVLGGKREDTLEEVRNKAPQQYLIDGSIVTANSYKKIIESLPYIRLATVFQTSYTNSMTQSTDSAIVYSALSSLGTTPPSNITSDVNLLLENKISPLDYVVYEPLKFLHLKVNVKANAPIRVAANINALVKGMLYTKYNIHQQLFKQKFDNSLVISDVVSYERNLVNVVVQTEAVCDLPAGSFIVDPSYPGYYKSEFSFDRSYTRMAGFLEGKTHCLKINIEFLCESCLDSSRTLFLFQDLEQNQSLSCNFGVAAGTSGGNFTICGEDVTIGSEYITNPIILATALYNKIMGITNITDHYTVSNPSAGVLTISPKTEGTQAATISTAIIGVTIRKIENVSYYVTQYPLITKITDYNYVINNILNSAVAPFRITEENSSIANRAGTYIPFKVNLDYYSLFTADHDVTPLASGTLSIPEYLDQDNVYLGFSNHTATELNANVRIQVMAIPFSSVVEGYYPNNIIQINEEDITIEVT